MAITHFSMLFVLVVSLLGACVAPDDVETSEVDDSSSETLANNAGDPGSELPDVEEARGESPEAAAAAPPETLVACGLSGWLSGSRFTYTIRNCHSYAVRRELDIGQGLDDCTCHYIPAGGVVTSTCSIAAWETVGGIKPC